MDPVRGTIVRDLLRTKDFQQAVSEIVNKEINQLEHSIIDLKYEVSLLKSQNKNLLAQNQELKELLRDKIPFIERYEEESDYGQVGVSEPVYSTVYDAKAEVPTENRRGNSRDSSFKSRDPFSLKKNEYQSNDSSLNTRQSNNNFKDLYNSYSSDKSGKLYKLDSTNQSDSDETSNSKDSFKRAIDDFDRYSEKALGEFEEVSVFHIYF